MRGKITKGSKPMTKTLTIGFLGGGNMARALIGGLAKKRPDARVHVIDHNPDKLEKLAQDFGAETHEAIGEWVGECSLLVLAVKPQNMKAALAPLVPFLNPTGAALSIAAGIEAGTLKGWLGGYPVLRAMPNTPAMAGCGTTGFWAGADADADAVETALAVLESVGVVVRVADEAGIDLVGAIPGSGPAYVFRFMEALARAGVSRGLSEEDAQALALGTVYGAAVLAKESGRPFAELRENVTSKGGTTAKALEVFNRLDIDGMVDQAVQAALNRTEEMKQLFR